MFSSLFEKSSFCPNAGDGIKGAVETTALWQDCYYDSGRPVQQARGMSPVLRTLAVSVDRRLESVMLCGHRRGDYLF